MRRVVVGRTVNYEINEQCEVRKHNDRFGKTFELRVGEPGTHKEATRLTIGEAVELRILLAEFIAVHQ